MGREALDDTIRKFRQTTEKLFTNYYTVGVATVTPSQSSMELLYFQLFKA